MDEYYIKKTNKNYLILNNKLDKIKHYNNITDLIKYFITMLELEIDMTINKDDSLTEVLYKLDLIFNEEFLEVEKVKRLEDKKVRKIYKITKR